MNQEPITSSQMNTFNHYEEGQAFIYQESAANKFTKWTLYLSPLFFFFISFIFLILILSIGYVSYTSSIEGAQNVLINLAHNLEKEPIIDILTANNSNSSEVKCSEGYNKEIVYYWPGIKSGCLCSDGTVNTWAYCQVYGNCQWVNEFTPQELYVWQTAYVCLKTFKDREWRVVAPEDVCPTGFFLSNYTNFLCLKNGVVDQSLVTKLKFVENAASSEMSTNNESVVSIGNVLFMKEKTNNTQWITNLTVSFSGFPCLNPSENPKPSTGFPLLAVNQNGCDEYGTSINYTSVLQNESQVNFYTDNEIYESVITNLPFYSEYFSNIYDYFQLFAEVRISLGNNAKCWEIDTEILKTSSSSITTLLGYVNNCAIIALVLTVIGLLLTLGQYFGRNVRIFRRYPCQGNFFPYLIFLLILCVIIILIVQAVLIWKKNDDLNDNAEISDYYRNLIDNGCFEIEGQKTAATNLMDYYADSFSSIYDLATFLFVWGVLWLVIFCICYFLRRFKYKDVVFSKPY